MRRSTSAALWLHVWKARLPKILWAVALAVISALFFAIVPLDWQTAVRQNRSPTTEVDTVAGVVSFAVRPNPKQLHRYSSFSLQVRLDDGRTVVALGYSGQTPTPGTIVTLKRFRHESGQDTFELLSSGP